MGNIIGLPTHQKFGRGAPGRSASEAPTPQAKHSGETSRLFRFWNLRGDAGGRHAKIHRLQDILIKQKPVGKVEKELALGYFDALAKLASQRIQPLTDFPLLEGVRALDYGTLFFRFHFPYSASLIRFWEGLTRFVG